MTARWARALALLAGTVLIAEDGDPKKAKKPAETPVSTLEDLYGDAGTRFQAALSFYNREPIAVTISPNISGYGFGVDDMVISWQESRLDEDVTNCAGGECADLEVNTTLSYVPTGFVELTVVDKSPYDAVNPKNDCNGNGSYLDASDDQDCNDNGTLDVVVKVTSVDDVPGEIVALDRTAVGSPVYKGRIPYSSLYNSPGSIFVQVSGTANPEVTASYEDRNDGTGARCANALSPEQQGFVFARTTIVIAAGRVDFRGVTIALAPGSPGDDDGFADAGETIDMTVRLRNKSGLDLDDVVVGLGTADPKIECISVPIVGVGSVANATDFTTLPFRFTVAGAPTVQRTSVEEVLRAHFTLTLRSNKFDNLTRVTDIVVDLDLNTVGPPPPTSPFVEDFEGTGLGKFTLQTLDAGKNTLALSEGYRCQYNDPNGLNSNSPNNPNCFLGFPGDPAGGVNDWHIQAANPANCNSGRAFTGVRSLRWGTCPATAISPVRDTTRLKQIDAVATVDPISLPVASVAVPELTFAHQASFVDNRNIASITSAQSVDRGIVQVQLANTAGDPIGDWLKITAFENVYDQQGTDNFTNCLFDPVDDGNDEDDFFDPTDPLRRLGPSSTCFPEFAYARSGNTDWRLPGILTNTGFRQDGPGMSGNHSAGFWNPGTWVAPRFDLSAFSGQRIRLRFLATSIEIGQSQTWDELFAVDNVVGDDGWFIDTIRIEQALAAPIVLAVDSASFAGLACPTCTLATAVLTASPTPPLSGPGQIVTLQASGSTLDACNGGTVQYQFWIDGNLNGIVGDAGDTLLRDWTDGSTFLDAPQSTTRYGVRVRCSTATSCQGGGVLDVAVTCPSTGNAKAPFGQIVHVDKLTLATPEPDPSVTVNWPASATVDLVRGNLAALRASGGNYTGTIAACLGNNLTANGVLDATNPGAGGATYFLVRPTVVEFCNQTPGYTTNSPHETSGRDAEIGADGNACP